MGAAAAARVNAVSRRKFPPKLAFDPNDWWDQQCRSKSGYTRIPHSILFDQILKRPALLMGGDGQLRLVLAIIDQTHGAAEKTDTRGNKTPRRIATDWMTKAAIAKLCNLKGEDKRQVDNILIDGETRGIFICEAGERGLYRFTLTPWLWKDAPDYKPNSIPKKPVVTETEDAGIVEPDPEPEPVPKALRLEPVKYEPGKPPPKPVTFPVTVAHQIALNFDSDLPVSVGTHIERGKISLSIVCRAPASHRESAKSSLHSNAKMGQNTIENKGPDGAEIAIRGVAAPLDISQLLNSWKCLVATTEREAASVLTGTFATAEPSVIHQFLKGLRAWSRYYDTIGWDKCPWSGRNAMTFSRFVQTGQWKTEPPATHGKSKTQARDMEAEADRAVERMMAADAKRKEYSRK